jgi:hypothetical protein
MLPDVKLASPAFEWAMICDLVGVESTSITVRTDYARRVGGFGTRLRRTEDREFLIRLSRLGAARILPDELFEKFWSKDGLSNQWASAGQDLVSYFREQPDYVGKYRKVGQYLATKTLIMHMRHRDLASFIGDARRFHAIGLFDEGASCRNHLQVKRYRRGRLNSKRSLAHWRPRTGVVTLAKFCGTLTDEQKARFSQFGSWQS